MIFLGDFCLFDLLDFVLSYMGTQGLSEVDCLNYHKQFFSDQPR